MKAAKLPWPKGLYLVEAPHFVAGFTVERGRAVRVAPILREALQKNGGMVKFKRYCLKRGWNLRMVL